MIRNLHAFSLLELVIVLGIFSAMLGFGLQALQTGSARDCYPQTEEDLATISNALHDFSQAHNRLPKPAHPGHGTNNPSFGMEQTGGLRSDSLQYAFAVPSGIASHDGVLIGVLPATTIGLPLRYASDCWGSKLTYAVTNALTSSNSTNGFMSGATGRITLKDSDATMMTRLASYVVISHGQDRFGATPLTAADSEPKNCSESKSKHLDKHNCDFSDSIFYNAARNTGASASNYFDDMLAFQSRTRTTSDCAAQAVKWLGKCHANISTMGHGDRVVLSNIAPDYTGNMIVSCKHGELVRKRATCIRNPRCMPLCWQTTKSECDFPDPAADCYLRTCGKYHFVNCRTVKNTPTCDQEGSLVPKGWRPCGLPGNCSSGLAEDTGYCRGGTCFACCGGEDRVCTRPGASQPLQTGVCAGWQGC